MTRRQPYYRPKVGDMVRFRWLDERLPARTYNVSAGEIMFRYNDGTYSIRVASGYSYERIKTKDILGKLD